MAILKVGDKLEVMVDKCRGTKEPIGSILTVIEADGHNPNHPTLFQTDAPLCLGGSWGFYTSCIGVELKLLTVTTTNATPQATQFKMEDVVEFPSGNQWKIIGDCGSYFEIELLNETPTSKIFGMKIGLTVLHQKAYMTTSKLISSTVPVVNNGSTYTVEVNENVHITKTLCECGAHKVKDHLHSSWCKLYIPTWKNA